MEAVMTDTRVTTPKAATLDRGAARRLVRMTGLMYLGLVILGMFSVMTLESMVVSGDAAATADRVAGSMLRFELSLTGWLAIAVLDVAVAVTLHRLLVHAGPTLSLVTAGFGIVYAAVLGAMLMELFGAYSLLSGGSGGLAPAQAQAQALLSLETFQGGFLVALVFFGVHLSLLGVLFLRSGAIPRVLSWLLVAAGAGYVLDTMGAFFVGAHGPSATAVLMIPAVLGEFGLTVWLLVKGVREPKQGVS